ncbi:MAG: carboxypeptidase regulatory-like domain-containing protein, partial [Terriglobales bacterium]
MKRALNTFVVLFAAIGFLLAGGRWASGQATTVGQVQGTVVDPSGAVVPGATVILGEPSVGYRSLATSNASGTYLFASVLPGTYTVTAVAKGFATKVYGGVVVTAGETANIKVQLQLGAATQTVTVSAAGQLLQTSSAKLATTVSTSAINNLPMAGRDTLPFAQLVPAAQTGGSQRFTTFNSMPNGAINISVDGANDNFQRFRTSTSAFMDPAGLRLGAIQEVTVSTSNLSTKADATGGAASLEFTTKRGTNQFHGSAFWQAENSGLNANSYQNDAYLAAGLTALGTKRPSRTNDFGMNIGGPILHNKLFFFLNFEWQNTPSTRIYSESLLTPAAQLGNFAYTRADNGQQQTVNLLQMAANARGGPYPSSVNPNIATILGQINSAAAGGTLSPNSTDAYSQGLEQTLSFTQTASSAQRWPTLRLDYQITPNLHWRGSYNLSFSNSNPLGSPVYPGDPVRIGGVTSTYDTFATGLDWTITPNLTNTVDFGILNVIENAQPENSFNAFQGYPYLPVPDNFAATGDAAFTPLTPENTSILPEPNNNPVWTLSDNVTWSRGNHVYTFGGQWRYSNVNDVYTEPPIAENLGISALDPIAGMFNTSASGCASASQGCFPGGLSTANNNEALQDAEALYSTLTGRVSSVSGLVPLDTSSKPYTYKPLGTTWLHEKQALGGVYFQDNWKVLPDLSLNYGLRWEFSGPLVNSNDFFTSPDLANFYGPSTGLFQPGVLNGVANPQITVRPQTYPADLKEIDPKFGFAWNPNFTSGLLGKLAGGSNLVIHGGFAVNHYDEGWYPWETASIGSLYNQTVSLNPGQFTPGSISFDPTGASFKPNTLPGSFQSSFPESALTFTQDGTFSTVDPNIKTPYVENWTFGIEREFAHSWALDVNYIGNHSVHEWMLYDLNEVNVFNNGFLQDFKNAQANLTASGGTSFAGPNPTPILSQAFAGHSASSTFANPSDIFLVQSGQAGALAGLITQTPAFFCNLVGNTFSPCVAQGYVSAGHRPTPTAYPINMFQVNPYAEGQALMYLSDPGSTTYSGLQAVVKHPFGHGLNFEASYTWSHALSNRYLGDYYSADGALDDFATMRDMGMNKGPSPYDLRNVFRTYFTYQLPFGSGRALNGNSMFNKVLGGWTVGSVITIQSGRNFKLAGGQNTYNYFDGPTPANALGTTLGILDYVPNENDNGVVLNGMNVQQLQQQVGLYSTGSDRNPISILPASLFGAKGAIQPESTAGAFGQQIFLSGPGLWDTDISLIKDLGVAEGVHLTFYGEFINAFNHPNFDFVDGYSGHTDNPAQYLP